MQVTAWWKLRQKCK